MKDYLLYLEEVLRSEFPQINECSHHRFGVNTLHDNDSYGPLIDFILPPAGKKFKLPWQAIYERAIALVGDMPAKIKSKS